MLLHSTSKTSFKTPVLDNTPNSAAAIEFDWKNKWLRGEEYAYILKNIDSYCKAFRMVKLPSKTHPASIYTEPQDGMVYFVEGDSVGSDFGFPRVDIKKRYRWKKMNFTTDLPKKRPCVTYIVASAVKCGKFFPNNREEGPSFRMHAVILNKNGVQTQKYKNKDPANNFNCMEEPHSNLSTTCSSIADMELEKSDFRPEDKLEAKKQANQGQEKNFVLCHIRKIDQNYKTSKGPGKRENPYDDEEEEDSELDAETQGFPQKFICGEDNFDSQSRTIRTPIRDDPSNPRPAESNNALLFQKLQKSGKKSQSKAQPSQEKRHHELSDSSRKVQYPFGHFLSDKKESNLKNFIPFKTFPSNSTYIDQLVSSHREMNPKNSVPKQQVPQPTTQEFLNLVKRDEGNNIDYLTLLNKLISHKNT